MLESDKTRSSYEHRRQLLQIGQKSRIVKNIEGADKCSQNNKNNSEKNNENSARVSNIGIL